MNSLPSSCFVVDMPHNIQSCELCKITDRLKPLKDYNSRIAFSNWLEYHKASSTWIPDEEGVRLLQLYFDAFLSYYGDSITPLEVIECTEYSLVSPCGLQSGLGTLGLESLLGIFSGLRASIVVGQLPVEKLSLLMIKNLEYLIRLTATSGSSASSWFNANSKLEGLYNMLFYMESVINDDIEKLMQQTVQFQTSISNSEKTPSVVKIDMCIIRKTLTLLKDEYSLKLGTLLVTLIEGLLDQGGCWKEFLLNWTHHPISPTTPANAPFRYWDLFEGKERFFKLILGITEILLKMISITLSDRISLLPTEKYHLLEVCLHGLGCLISNGLIKVDLLHKLGVLDIFSSFLGWPPFILCHHDGSMENFINFDYQPEILCSEFRIQLTCWRLLNFIGDLEFNSGFNIARRLTGSSVVDLFSWVVYFSSSKNGASAFQSNYKDYPLFSRFPARSDGTLEVDVARMSLADDLMPRSTQIVTDSHLSSCIQGYLSRKLALSDLKASSESNEWTEYEPPRFLDEEWTKLPEIDILFQTLLTFCLKESLVLGTFISKDSSGKRECSSLDSILLQDFGCDAEPYTDLKNTKPPLLWSLAIETLMDIFGKFESWSDFNQRPTLTTPKPLSKSIESIDLEELQQHEILHNHVKRALSKKMLPEQSFTHPPALQLYLLSFLAGLMRPVHDGLLYKLTDFPPGGDTAKVIKPVTLLHRWWSHNLIAEMKLLDLLCSEYFFCWGSRNVNRYRLPDSTARVLQQGVLDFFVYAGTLPEINYRMIYSRLLTLLDITVHARDCQGVLLVSRGLYRIFKYNRSAVQSSLKYTKFFESILPALEFSKASLDLTSHDNTITDTLTSSEAFQMSGFWMLVSVLDYGLLRHQELSLLAIRHPPATRCLLGFLESDIFDLVNLSICHINNMIMIGSAELPTPQSSSFGAPQLLSSNSPRMPPAQSIERLIFHYLEAMSKASPSASFDLGTLILQGIRECISTNPPYSPARKAVQMALAAGQCFEYLFTLLEVMAASHDPRTGCGEIILTFTALLQHNDQFKADLAKSDGYARLCIAILDSESPLTKATFDGLFGMLVDHEDWSISPMRIANKYVIAVLMDLFTIMEPDLQLLLMDRMILLAASCNSNTWALCNSSLISKLLRSPVPTSVSHGYVEKTMGLLEVLGSYSITISDVKLLLNSLCFNDEDDASTTYLASHHASLLEVLYEISQHSDDLSFLQFKGKGSGVQIHHLSFPNSGYTFFTWLRLENLGVDDRAQPQVLYSFSDQKGTKLLAQFDRGSLTFQILLKSGKHETLVTRYKFTYNRWYFITIVHSCPKFSWGFGQPELLVFVDGDMCSQAQLDYPTFHAPSLRCFVGARLDDDAPQLEPGVRFGGDYLVNSFSGQMATLYLVGGPLSAANIAAIYRLGKEHASIFSSSPATSGVHTASAPPLPIVLDPAPRLLFTFHARASRGSLCYNLATYQSTSTTISINHIDPESQLHATITRIEKCSTLSLQNALHMLGGVEVLLPLLLRLEHPEILPPPRGGALDLQTNRFIQKGSAPSFFALVSSLIKDHFENQRMFINSNGIRVTAHLLTQAHPTHLTVATYQSIMALANIVEENETLRDQVYTHLLFNMRIWMYSGFQTQAYILDLIKNLIDSRRTYFTQAFPMIFFIDMLRTCYYYSPDPHAMPTTHQTTAVERPSIALGHLYQLRSIVLDIIQTYLKFDRSGPTSAQALVRHLIYHTYDHQHSCELLRLLLEMVRSDLEAPLLKQFLQNKGYELLCDLVHRPFNPLKAAVYDMMSFLAVHPKVPDRWRLRIQTGLLSHSPHDLISSPALDSAVYMSMVQFSLLSPIPPITTKLDLGLLASNYKLPPNSPSPTILLRIMEQLHHPEIHPSLQQMVLRDMIHLCEHYPKLSFKIVNFDSLLPTLLPLLPVPQDLPKKPGLGAKMADPAGDSSGVTRSSQLVLEFLCTLSLKCFSSADHAQAGAKLVYEVVFHWWSSSSVHCRQHGIIFHRDDFKQQLDCAAPAGWQAHGLTMFLIRQFLAQMCARLEEMLNSPQSPSLIHEKVLDGILSVQQLVDTLLFHHWELEEVVFSRLAKFTCNNGTNLDCVELNSLNLPVEIKRLSDPKLPLLQLITVEDLVHQLPNNPWEESLELTVPFLSLLNMVDITLGTTSSPCKGGGDRRSTSSIFNGVYSSPDKSPCQTMLRVLMAGLEVRDDERILNTVSFHLKLFFERHRQSNNNDSLCLFTHILNDRIPALLGTLQEATLAVLPSLKELALDEVKNHPLVTMYMMALTNYRECLSNADWLPSTPDADPILFLKLISSEDWLDQCDNRFFTSIKQGVEEGFTRFARQANELGSGVNQLIKKIRRNDMTLANDHHRYTAHIEQTMYLPCHQEAQRQASLELERQATLNRISRGWLVKLQELARENGSWQTYWKLDFMENYSRMHLRLTINHEFDLHSEASAKRDKLKLNTNNYNGNNNNLWKRSSINNYLTRASSRAERIKERLSKPNTPLSSTPNSSSEKKRVRNRSLSFVEQQQAEDIVVDVVLGSNDLTSPDDSEWNFIPHHNVNNNFSNSNCNHISLNNNSSNNNSNEEDEYNCNKILIEVECSLIFLLATIHGKLRLTQQHLTFLIDRQRILEEINNPNSTVTTDWDMIRDRRWNLAELREVHYRKHMLRNSAIEFFFLDQHGIFFNFPELNYRQKLYDALNGLALPNLVGSYVQSPSEMFRKSNLTKRWLMREISNFDYLMQLNSIAGRSYNDLTQYFVFPWILSDYDSSTINLDDPRVYRDLRLPMGAIDPTRLHQSVARYNEFDDPNGIIKKFHYGTHYSSAGSVAFYLLRLEPFTSIHIALQSGKFDHADRQFRSLASCWHSCTKGSGDVKELIPEFFYLPEFLKNTNKFDLGKTQGGIQLDHVELPGWAKSPEHFIEVNRAALESEYVSAHLHHWIDLIFGFKQLGQPAIDAHNVFYYLTYEGAVDIDQIDDPLQRRSIMEQIYHFGQTPSQLLTQPHPQRQPRVTDIEHPISFYSNNSCSDYTKFQWRNISLEEGYKTYLLKLPMRSLCSLNVGPNSHLIVVDQLGNLGYYKLTYSNNSFGHRPSKLKEKVELVNQPFTLESINQYRIPSPFAHNIRVSSRSIVNTRTPLVITTGHWDNTFKVLHLGSGKLINSIGGGHGDLVTCASVSEDGLFLVTGSRSSKVLSWRVDQLSDVGCRYEVAFHGHRDAVTCVAVNVEYDLVASGSNDGTCILHSLKMGYYLQSIVPNFNSKQLTSSIPNNNLIINQYPITHLLIASSLPALIIISDHQNTHHLHTYTLNGTQRYHMVLPHQVHDAQLTPDHRYLLLVNTAAQLLVYHLSSMEQVLALDLPLVANCIGFDHRQGFVLGCSDGKLLIVNLG